MIRIRGWHIDLNKMFSPEEMAKDQMALLPTGYFINVHGQDTAKSTIYPTNKFIPLLSTGLKDMNGKEIYEGDIIGNGEHCWVIKFFDAAFWAQMPNSQGGVSIYMFRDSIEIIGNIYENHELLTTTKE